MRSQFLIALLVALLAAGSFWYRSTADICPVPMTYRLGTLSPEFNLNEAEAISFMSQAEAVWEEEAGRDLFIYDEDSDFVVNFVFDERQEFADTEMTETQALDAQRQRNEQVLETVSSLQAEYQKLKENYQAKVASYEERLSAYNQTVQRYNDRGGAPAGEYEALETERRSLDAEVSDLSTMTNELNNLAEQINDLSQRGNELINAYNRQVSSYNAKYGYEREFTQGDYQGDSINIYKFSSDKELLTVMIHEFGHALGIHHVEGESSVMYYLLADVAEPVTLSEEDKQAFVEACGDGTEIGATIKRHIRALLATLNI